MSVIAAAVRSFIQEEDGIAATEYVMLLGIIAIILAGIMATFADELTAAWGKINGAVFTF